MIRFENDYSETCHSKILENLQKIAYLQNVPYGEDVCSERARLAIKKKCNKNCLDIHFLAGGTQTNMTAISAILRPHQGVIAAKSGHINVHETGAIEATGHKVIAIEGEDGKLTAEQIEKVYLEHWNDPTHEHIVQPAMVYISFPTELGTVYSKEELHKISKVCQYYNLPLFLDGARLGYGLMAENNDLTLNDIANLTDIFSIGGTKIGALFGEALIIVKDEIKKDFRYLMKQRGGMLAKGWILGTQFLTLFDNDLYFKISKKAVDMAMSLREAFAKKGFGFYSTSTTNQQFPILPNDVIKKLSSKYIFSTWEKLDENNSVVRFCTSWATKQTYIRQFVEDLENIILD